MINGKHYFVPDLTDSSVMQPPGVGGDMKLDSPISGDLVAITEVEKNDRVRIPKEIIDWLGLEKGARVYWIRNRYGQFCLTNHIKIRGNLTEGRARGMSP